MASAAFKIALEDILSNAPAKEPSVGPTVSYGMGYRGNDPDAPDDTPLHEAFDEGRTRGFWEACRMIDAAMNKAGLSDGQFEAREAYLKRLGDDFAGPETA